MWTGAHVHADVQQERQKKKEMIGTAGLERYAELKGVTTSILSRPNIAIFDIIVIESGLG